MQAYPNTIGRDDPEVPTTCVRHVYGLKNDLNMFNLNMSSNTIKNDNKKIKNYFFEIILLF